MVVGWETRTELGQKHLGCMLALVAFNTSVTVYQTKILTVKLGIASEQRQIACVIKERNSGKGPRVVGKYGVKV